MYKLKMLKMDAMIEEIATNMEILCAGVQQRMDINSNIYQQKTELDIEMEELLACLRKVPKWRHHGIEKTFNKTKLVEGTCGSKASGQQQSKVWDPGGLQPIEDS
jgi:hypothetical protein